MPVRTDAEILARIDAVGATDWSGAEQGDLIAVLPFDAAQPWLKDGVTAEEWEPGSRDHDAVLASMLDYMEFAWNKANGCRRLSASRSLDHMSAWLWLLGWDAAADQIRTYSHYGKPQLRAICEAFGWDWREWDNGRWQNFEDDPGLAAPESVPPLERPPA